RVIDGIDQTAMLLEGDGNSRRDYYHIYTGPYHAATIKQQFKRVWMGNLPGLVGPSFYNLYHDPREKHPMMAQFLWAWGPFDMMKSRHDALNAKYPFRPVTHDIPFGGIENLRPETVKYLENYKDAFKARAKH
ncbi:MAG: sulfatase, partial [Campylobacterota bacterium]|nr:sulfatase [Campylobacterota bacterium]